VTTSTLDVDAAPISQVLSAFAELAQEIGSPIRPGAIRPDPRPKPVLDLLLARFRAVIGALRERAGLLSSIKN
jgi:hypothetical protein